MSHEDKREYYRKMGWCECANCRTLFYDYEDYETHECVPPMMGIQMSDGVKWEVNDDSKGNI